MNSNKGIFSHSVNRQKLNVLHLLLEIKSICYDKFNQVFPDLLLLLRVTSCCVLTSKNWVLSTASEKEERQFATVSTGCDEICRTLSYKVILYDMCDQVLSGVADEFSLFDCGSNQVDVIIKQSQKENF